MTLVQGLVLIGIVVAIICIPIQRRALNKIAFGRSMFITFTAIILGVLIVAIGSAEQSPASQIVGTLLILIGYAMLIFMAVKSLQRLRSHRNKHPENVG